MQENKNRTMLIIVAVIIVFSGISLINSCRSDRSSTNITVVSDAAEGLDLQALSELVKKADSAESLETALNKPDGINNLDLNEDGKVDFIKVEEYGNKTDAHGFSLTVEPEKGEVQEVASIEISESGEDADVEVRGNEQLYGRNHYYHSHYPRSSFLLWGYFMRPHPFYASRWGYGYYPRYYGGGYAPVGRSVYSRRVTRTTAGSTATRASSSRMTSRSGLSNPNAGRSANSGVTARLRSPTSTQKSFQSRNPSKAAGSGGFGRGGSVRSSSRTRSTSSGK